MAKKEQFIFEAPKKEKHKSSKKTAILSLLLVTFLTLLSLLLLLYSAGEGDIQKGFTIIGNALANGDPAWLAVIAGLMLLSYFIEALIILVFSSFTKVLDHLSLLLKEAGTKSYYIYGGVEADDRLSMAESFNTKNDVNVMLVSLKAGGTGLNLHGADIVLHLDPWWNIAAEEQATDRAYRIGQKRPVSVVKLICHNSIEEKVVQLQENKRELYNQVIKSGDEAISRLNIEDIKFLLS